MEDRGFREWEEEKEDMEANDIMKAKTWQETVMGQFTRYGKYFLNGKRAYIEKQAPQYDKHTEEAAVDAGCLAVAEAQAEITGKIMKLEGMKIVAEWVEGEDAIDRMVRERWHDFLKENFKDNPELLKDWGIE